MRYLIRAYVATAFLAACESAQATDFAIPMSVKAPLAASYDWTGSYVGGHVGYSRGNARDALSDRTTGEEKLQALADASDQLQKDFGTWRIAWGSFNRYQRVRDDIGEPHFSDDEPSIPVPFVYSRWGSLASFAAKRYPNTKRYYGTSGNSFVAIIDFGPKIRAMAVITGGESGDPTSPHFNDQALRYARGQLRQVYFYPADLTGHVVSDYHPGA